MKFRSALATSVALACLTSVALASGVQFRGTSTIGEVAQDAELISLRFASRTGTLLGGTVVSDVVRYDGPNLTASVADGQVRVCPSATCGSDGGWASSAQVSAGQFVQLRRGGPQAAGQTVTAALEIAGQRFTFDATARPQAPAFEAIAVATTEPGTSKESDLSTFHGWVEAPISVTGGDYRVCSAQGSCGSFTTVAGTVRDGDQVQLRVVAGAFGESRTASIVAGGASASFRVDVRTKDTSPDTIVLGGVQSDAGEPGSIVESSIATLAGFDEAPVSIVGIGASYSLNGESFTTTAGTAKAGDTVRVRLTTGTFGERRQAILSVGDATATFSSTVRARDETPDAFSFVASESLEPAVVATSPSMALVGFDDASISVSGGEYSLNGGTFTTVAGAAKAGDQVRLRLTTGDFSQTRTATLTVGGTTSSFTATTRSKDTRPDAISLGSGPVGVEPASIATSQIATLAGFDDATIDIAGTGATYSLNGAAFTTTAGTAKAGDTVRVQLTAGTFGEKRTGTLTVGGNTASWSSTVREKDTTPIEFAFSFPGNQTPGTSVVSSLATLQSFDDAPITIMGGEYSLNGGQFTSVVGTARGGDKVQIRGVAPAYGEARVVTVDVGGFRADTYVASRAKDTTPDSFSLGTGPTGVEPGSVSTSTTATLVGFDDAAISISGAGATYSVNGGTFATTTGTVKAGDTVRVQSTAGAFGETRQATLTVGGTNATWSTTVRTKDTTPNSFGFSALANATPNTTYTTSTTTLGGFDDAQASISGSGATYSLNGGAFGTATQTVRPGDTIAVRLVSGAGFSETRTATVAVGTYSTNYTVTTRAGASSISQMSITDSGIRNALIAEIGDQGWTPCSGSGTCQGNYEYLTVHRGTSSGYSFGVYFDGRDGSWDRSSQGQWVAGKGFYFTNGPTRTAYIRSENTSSGAGQVTTIGSGSHFYGFYHARSTTPAGLLNNGAWSAGYTITGQGDNVRTPTSVEIYRR